MCPLWPLHIIVFYLLTIVPVWVLCQSAPKLLANFSPPAVDVHMEEQSSVDVHLYDLNVFKEGDVVDIYSTKEHIALASFRSYELKSEDIDKGWRGVFNVSGNFLGKSEIIVQVSPKAYPSHVKADPPPVKADPLSVTVTRKERVIDRIFVASVATLVSLIYINFGCAVSWPTVVATLKRPIGPAIGFCSQFVFMPLISYGLGLLLFPDNVEMQLGMFFTGVSPGGGASNIWTYVLNGNLDLSITMTTISTIAAFGMMPLWLFTLGRVIFESGDLGVPYNRIAGFAVGLVIPLGIGLLAQRYLPRFANLMVRILKGFSSLLLLFIIVFAIVTNLYLFELFSWQIVVAGMGVPWLGYLAGYLGGRAFRQPSGDCLAIALETGIQNTGIAIFLLRFSLPQPAADLTTVVPVAVAIMTPIPMICIYIYQVIRNRIAISREKKMMSLGRNELSLTHSETGDVLVLPSDKKY